MTLSKQIKIIIASTVTFGLSLTLTAITYKDYDGIHSISGLSLLLSGSTAVLGGGLPEWIIWLANPLYFYSIFAFKKGNLSARKASKAATILSFWFLTWQQILVSANGRQALITHRNFGYWLWVASIVILTISIHKSIKPKGKIKELLKNSEESGQPKVDIEPVVEDRVKIDEFKARYKFKTREDLQKIIDDRRFIPEAKLAAKELLSSSRQTE